MTRHKTHQWILNNKLLPLTNPLINMALLKILNLNKEQERKIISSQANFIPINEPTKVTQPKQLGQRKP